MSAIVWWEVETATPEEFMRFHAALTGWSFAEAFSGSELGADYWIIRQDGVGTGGLQRSERGIAGPSVGTRVYREVEDLETVLARVEELGGAVERGRTELGGDDRWFATFRDSCGVSFGLWTARPCSL